MPLITSSHTLNLDILPDTALLLLQPSSYEGASKLVHFVSGPTLNLKYDLKNYTQAPKLE